MTKVCGPREARRSPAPLCGYDARSGGIAPIRVKATPTHPMRWDDGTYSVHSAAAVLGVYLGSIYHWLLTGRFKGVQLAKGMPSQIQLTDEQISE